MGWCGKSAASWSRNHRLRCSPRCSSWSHIIFSHTSHISYFLFLPQVKLLPQLQQRKTFAHLHGQGQVLLTDCVSRRWTWAALPDPGGRSWWTCSWGRSPGTSCPYLFSSHDQMTLHHPLPLLLHLVVPFVASVEPPAAVSPLVCSHCCCSCLEHLRRLVPEYLNAPGAPLGLRVARLVIRQ